MGRLKFPGAVVLFFIVALLHVVRVDATFCPVHFLVARRVEELIHRHLFEQHFEPLVKAVVAQHPEYRYHEHEYACWPDDTGKTEETARWHYHGKCLAADDGGPGCEGAEEPEGLIVSAIIAAERNVTDMSLPLLERAYAFLRLIHLVTDIHQPLHVCNRRSKAHPKGDRGGSTFYLGNSGKFTNLHALYDYAGGLNVAGAQRPYHLLSKQEYASLSQRYEEFSVWYPVDPDTAALGIWDWVGEGMELCERFVYKDLKEGTYPPDKYVEDVQLTVMNQASKAAFRIAKILLNVAHRLDPTTIPKRPEFVPRATHHVRSMDEHHHEMAHEDDPRHFGSAPVEGVWLEPEEHRYETQHEADLPDTELDALHEVIAVEEPHSDPAEQEL